VRLRGGAVERLRRLLLGLGILGIILALVFGGRELAGVIPRFARWVQTQGSAGMVLFVLGYAAATVLFVPGSLLTLAAGAVFGLIKGTALVFIGATIGETAAFLIARYFARAQVERRVAGDARFEKIDRAIGQHGRKIVLLLRLSPLFPFNLLNYALGLTRVTVRDYVIASIGILPGTLLYVYAGKVVGDIASIASGVSVPRGPAYYTVLGLGLAATAAVTIMVARIARQSLESAHAG
jgi:uncharacterized membrane protein YdjX (TVP38/TMEM64 family)